MTDDINLRPLSKNGNIKFTIKAPDTQDNQNIHRSFWAFCQDNTKNDYTLGLRRLLEIYDYVNSVNALWDGVEDLKERVTALESKKEEDNKKSESKDSVKDDYDDDSTF